MTVESFRATIYFGLLYIALVAIAALVWRRDLALLMIIATAGLAYLTQCLATSAYVVADPVNAATAAVSAAQLIKVARMLWLITICVGTTAGVMLMVA